MKHVGAYSSSSTAIFGVRAEIEKFNPDLCSDATNSVGVSTAWAMVSAQSIADPSWTGYAQVGYGDFGPDSLYDIIYGTSGMKTFTQWTRKCYLTGACVGPGHMLNDAVKTVMVAAPAAGFTRYDVRRNASDGFIHMYAGGTHINAMTYNTAGDWNAAWRGEFMGETRHPRDNLVGTAADPTNFRLLQKYGSSGALNFFTGLSQSPTAGRPARYKFGWTTPPVGGQGFQLHTNPL